jgi:type IV secretion system protein VirD4
MTDQYGLASKHKRSRWWLYPVFFVALALLCLTYATQTVAIGYNYHPDLGSPIFGQIYWPWMIIDWYRTIPDSKIIKLTITTAQLLFMMPQLALMLFWLTFARKPKGKKDIHGTAAWAEDSEIREAGLLNGDGVYIGGHQLKNTLRYLRHNGPEHIISFAPTRSGKGVGQVLPTLLSWRHSALIIDIKGENWALTSGWRKQSGQKVFKLDPTDITGSSARYNPLAEVRLGPQAIPDAQNIASMIVDPDGKGLKDYWNKAAFSFLGGTVLHCIATMLEKHGRCATLTDLSFMLADENQEAKELILEMKNIDQAAILKSFIPDIDIQDANAIGAFISAAAQEMRNKAGTELSGVLSTAAANLALYRDPVVAKVTSDCDFKIDDLMNHDDPVSLYLVIRPSDIDRLRPLFRLIMNVMLRRLTEKMEFKDGRSVTGYKHRLLLMFDEFTSLGKMDIMERALAFMAGYGIKAFLIIQDFNQLHKEYGRDETIMSNCHIRTAYAPNKMSTAEELSKMTGKKTVVQQKVSLSGNRSGHLGRANVSISEVARPLLTPDECSRLPGAKKDGEGNILEAGDMLIFPAGFSPIYGRQILYFNDPVFSERAKIPAPEKSDSLAASQNQIDQSDNQELNHEGIYEEYLA